MATESTTTSMGGSFDANGNDDAQATTGAETSSETVAKDDAARPLPLRGINLAGAEFGDALPGIEGRDYAFPTTQSVDYYLSKGMNTFRVGFKWERLQPDAKGEFAPAYFAKLDALVAYTTGRGARVILNPHNFARYYGTTVGSEKVPSAVFADLWARLADRYAGNDKVIFNLVNEPHDIDSEQWVDAANAAIAAIREAGATNVIQVPGNSWTGAHSWSKNHYGTPNSVAMLDIKDPIDNSVFEVHQYLDETSGGKNGECVSSTIGRERLATWVAWLREHGKRGFVGEFAGGENRTCIAAVDDMAEFMYANADVLDGWLWWAGGPKWGDYVFTLEPKGGKDAPYMARLAKHLRKGAE